MTGSNRRALAVVAGSLAALLSGAAHAGGPNIVNGAGQPVVWAQMPVPFNPDRGSLGTLTNAAAVSHLQSDATVWNAVPSSTVVLAAGDPLPEDVDLGNYLTYFGVCGDDLSPVIFDKDGSITDDVYGVGANNHVIGFAAINCGTYVPPVVTEGLAVLNGRFLDGVDTPTNAELTVAQFDAVMIHEFGHYLGLDHSQVGLAQAFDGDPSNDAAVATMFPILVNGDAMSSLHLDDRAAISALYPEPSFATDFATITGSILLADGTTTFQGANVVARSLTDPLAGVVSGVSGTRFANGFPGGPPPLALSGLYELPGLPPGDYTVEIESVFPSFLGGSGVGPLNPPAVVPGPDEFWNGANEAGSDPPDDPTEAAPLTIGAGATTSGIDVVINEYPPPPNDECSAATVVAAAPFTDTVQTANATRGAFDPLQSCPSPFSEQNEHTVWYRFTPPVDGVVSAATLGSTYDTVLTAHAGACGTFGELGCNDNANASTQSVIQVPVSAGVPVYFDVSARANGGAMHFALDFTPAATCAAAPVGGCRESTVAGKSSIAVRGGTDPAARRLTWKWQKGAATSLAELGNPTTIAGTSYAFCLYDGGGALVTSVIVPPGGHCAGKDCWRASAKSYKYRDKDRTPDGIYGVDLVAGADGKARIGTKGAGALLPATPLPLAPPLTAQLVRSGGTTCWQSRYVAAGIVRNDADQLKAH